MVDFLKNVEWRSSIDEKARVPRLAKPARLMQRSSGIQPRCCEVGTSVDQELNNTRIVAASDICQQPVLLGVTCPNGTRANSQDVSCFIQILIRDGYCKPIGFGQQSACPL